MAKGRLAGVSNEGLEAELRRRQQEADSAPEPLVTPDFTGIVELARSMVKQHADDHGDRDNDHWCFEAVLRAVYGDSIWKWWNSHC